MRNFELSIMPLSGNEQRQVGENLNEIFKNNFAKTFETTVVDDGIFRTFLAAW